MITEQKEKKETEKYFLTKEEKDEIEKEVQIEFYKNKFINKIYNLFSKKEKNKFAQTIFIMGLKGCRKNYIHNKFIRTNKR